MVFKDGISMKKLKIYLDTSTISHLHAHDTPDKMKDTLALWQDIKAGKFEVFLSETTLEEVGRCPEEKLSILMSYLNEIEYIEISDNDEIDEVARMIVDMGILNAKSHDDCMHIASAIVGGCDIIVSWNFRHMVNIKTINGVRAIASLQGYRGIDIVAPPSMLTE
jgi:predicted nucleic acid-binding protein